MTVLDWQPIQGVPHFLPTVSWDMPQHPSCNLLRNQAGNTNSWMDGQIEL